MTESAQATVEPVRKVVFRDYSADPFQDISHERVFVASLISVLTDAFCSAKDLYRRLKRKSQSDDEDNKSKCSDHDSVHDRRDSHTNIIESLGRHVRWSLDRREKHDDDKEDELVCSASAQVQATYDRAYGKLGERYARGDDIAKTQLQSHIIDLQQVLISIHQDLMLSNYSAVSSSHSQLIHLIQTVRTSRRAAIQALDLLYQRMLAGSLPDKPEPCIPISGDIPAPEKSPNRSRSSSSSSSVEPPVKPKPRPKPNHNINRLFCRYALDLQYNPHMPLSQNFGPDGNKRCPHCHTCIAVRPKKAWEVIVENKRWYPKRKGFIVRNVFVVKCHRAGGGFTCVLCAKYGDADTVCRSVAALMEHLWKEHTAEDLERDEDIVGC